MPSGTARPAAKKPVAKLEAKRKAAAKKPTAKKPASKKGMKDVAVHERDGGGPYQAVSQSYPSRPTLHGSFDGELFLCGRKVAKMNPDLPFDESLQDVEGVCKQCSHILTLTRRVHPGWEKV